MEIRFGQARYEINPRLFERIDNLCRDFPFHVSSWQVKHRRLTFNTEASGFIQEAEGAMSSTRSSPARAFFFSPFFRPGCNSSSAIADGTRMVILQIVTVGLWIFACGNIYEMRTRNISVQERIMTVSNPTAGETWPSLSLDGWSDTYATLHLWTQIVGKMRLAKSPWTNHSWHVTLYVTPRGLTTGSIPYGSHAFQIDFDFVEHELRIEHDRGAGAALLGRRHAGAGVSRAGGGGLFRSSGSRSRCFTGVSWKK